MEVSCLITRVKSQDKYDWGKLKILFKYLKVTKHMKLPLIVEYLLIVNWWVDASYNTRCMMSLGKGGVLSSSMKQKINVNISTEGE